VADPDLEVRLAAAQALRNHGPDVAVDPLIRALGDVNPGVREVALASLRHLTGEDRGTSAEAWRAWRRQ
jgi:HEAT repeat protein